MAEHKYAFLKNNRVQNVIILDNKNDAEAELHKTTYGYDEFIYAGTDNTPAMHSLRDGDNFIPADYDFLYSIGLAPYDNAGYAAWLADNANEL